MTANAQFDMIYREYHARVTSYVRGKIQNIHEAEDVVSSVFVKVYERWDSYDPERASVSTWIYTITRSAVTDYYRKRQVHSEYADYMDADLEEIPEDSGDEMLDRLADGLTRLKEKERDVIVLHYYEGYTLKQVADMMGMSYINAKVLHKKALGNLRMEFSQ